MYVTNDTDYDNTTDYDNFLKDFIITGNCTINENNIDIIIPSVLLTIPCGLSFLCSMSLLVYTLIKPLLTNKR